VISCESVMINGRKNHIGAQLQKISTARSVFRVIAVLSLSLFTRPSLLCGQNQTSIPEEIEWTWEVRPEVTNPKLPNVLLIGDSITRNCFPQVNTALTRTPTI